MAFDNKSVFITGGAGFLGRAIVKRAVDENWNCSFTVFSRDTTKHHFMKRMFPDADIRYVAGDIQDYVGLYNAIVGHDIVLHLAAFKYIPESVVQPTICHSVNVIGSQNVLNACVEAQIESVMGISTDKACKPINPYGTSKMMMESIFREYANTYPDIEFHLVRYGNVLSSTGSFITSWRKDKDAGRPVRSTDPRMSRFWLTQETAVDVIINGMQCDSGAVFVPELKACSVGDIVGWVLGDYPVEFQGNRGGERIHELLIAREEWPHTQHVIFKNGVNGWEIRHDSEPFNEEWEDDYTDPYSSNIAERLTKEEFLGMIGE